MFAEKAIDIITHWEMSAAENFGFDRLMDADIHYMVDSVNMRQPNQPPLILTCLTFEDNSRAIRFEDYLFGKKITSPWTAVSPPDC